tara:strand:- start:658 stop:879 length:222 start_codon:yes stop_codon:yes gene_type:complete
MQQDNDTKTTDSLAIEAPRLVICDGNCNETHGGHSGKIVRVTVTGADVDWGEMNYCENAVNEDISRGLTVHYI